MATEAETFLILKFGSVVNAVNAWMARDNTDNFSPDELEILANWMGIDVNHIQRRRNCGLSYYQDYI